MIPFSIRQAVILGAVHIVSDITKRKQAELKLLSSEQKYRALINHSPDVIMQFDLNGRHQFVSERVEDYVDLRRRVDRKDTWGI